MVLIATLLLISFALFFLGPIAKTQRLKLVFLLSGVAVWNVTAFVTKQNDFAFDAIMVFPFVSLAASYLIAPTILRRRLMPPRVLVKGGSTSGIAKFLISSVTFFWIAVFCFQVVTGGMHSIGSIVFTGFMTVSMVVCLILILFERTEIGGNGLFRLGGLQSWEEYDSFSWECKKPDDVELRLESTSWLGKPHSTRLRVPPEDRETVQQILEAHLPDLIPVHD